MKSIILILLSTLLLSGCSTISSWFQPDLEKSVEELAAEGMDSYNSGDYKTSIEHFEKLKDFYPFSKYAALAELKIADAHYELGHYEEAILAYEEFANLHPRNEAIPYVVYQIGMCHYNQLSTIDRDQEPAIKALDIFERLQQQYPASTYAKKAREHIKNCYKSLAAHDLYVGKFYMKNKRYKAALTRFKIVISNYPDVGIHQEALNQIARCEAKGAEQEAKYAKKKAKAEKKAKEKADARAKKKARAEEKARAKAEHQRNKASQKAAAAQEVEAGYGSEIGDTPGIEGEPEVGAEQEALDGPEDEDTLETESEPETGVEWKFGDEPTFGGESEAGDEHETGGESETGGEWKFGDEPDFGDEPEAGDESEVGDEQYTD